MATHLGTLIYLFVLSQDSFVSRCLEGMFDTWGAFGFGFVGNLNLGGPAPIGARKASLSAKVEPYMQEVALSEQVRS